MLNRYGMTPKVDARTTNNNTLNFNSVSGTLCKSHPKSIFIWFKRDDELAKYILRSDPKYNIKKTKADYPFSSSYYKDFEPITVLQLMLTGNDYVIAEIVSIEDFISQE